MPIHRSKLETACNILLQPAQFKDYCPNGLQVEGDALISRVALAVTANQAAIDAAIAWGAQALLVHHGLMWRGEDGTVTGFRKSRLESILSAGLNVLAYHLPLDAHLELGNNVQLGQKLGLRAIEPLAAGGIVYHGSLPQPHTAQQAAAAFAKVLARPVTVLGDASKPIAHVAWCTGGGASYYEQAVALGADAFITGEATEQYVHMAVEYGVPLLLAGHHATERYGVQALGQALASQLGIEVRYFEVDSPL